MTPPHIVLVGLPGSGKSTVGRLLAAALNAPFVDLDLEIERRQRMSIADIFASLGEQAFRAMERAITQDLASRPPSVVSSGGGWMLDPANVLSLRPPARIIHLIVTPTIALTRLGQSREDRPLLAGPGGAARLAQMADERRVQYTTADEAVDTAGRTPEQVAEWCLALAHKWGWPIHPA